MPGFLIFVLVELRLYWHYLDLSELSTRVDSLENGICYLRAIASFLSFFLNL